MGQRKKIVAWVMSGGLALYAIADIASHTKDLIELPSNANIVWQVVRSVFLGFTPQAIFVLAFAAIIFLFTISETWMPLARALQRTISVSRNNRKGADRVEERRRQIIDEIAELRTRMVVLFNAMLAKGAEQKSAEQ
jgi:hypothetical protein